MSEEDMGRLILAVLFVLFFPLSFFVWIVYKSMQER